jgi:hypothetical protein
MMIRRVVSITLAIALGSVALPHLAIATAPPKASVARHAFTHGASHASRTIRFRPPRSGAAQEARRLGAAVGQGCTGKADMARNDHEWVVLCSNGKTYVVEMPTQQPGAPAAECSLAGIGPQPACFAE